jgi:hypothetical protein
MHLPIPKLSLAATGAGYLWQLEITGAGMELDRSSADSAEVSMLDGWAAFAQAVANITDGDPYKLVDETLAKIFGGYEVPEEIVNRFSAGLFDWVCENRAALAQVK